MFYCTFAFGSKALPNISTLSLIQPILPFSSHSDRHSSRRKVSSINMKSIRFVSATRRPSNTRTDFVNEHQVPLPFNLLSIANIHVWLHWWRQTFSRNSLGGKYTLMKTVVQRKHSEWNRNVLDVAKLMIDIHFQILHNENAGRFQSSFVYIELNWRANHTDHHTQPDFNLFAEAARKCHPHISELE